MGDLGFRDGCNSHWFPAVRTSSPLAVKVSPGFTIYVLELTLKVARELRASTCESGLDIRDSCSSRDKSAL